MKKAFNIIKNVFTWLIIAVAMFMMVFTIVSTATFDQDNRSLLGYKAFIVKSDSMSKTDFSAGDLILIKNINPSELKEGDIIAFKSTNSNNYGETVTHKIRSLTVDENGDAGFITYGTTTGVDDEEVVKCNRVLGKYTAKLPYVGHFFAFLKTVPGYIVCILTPFLLIIGMQVFNCMKLFKKYKEEQMEEAEADKKALEDEKAKTKKMEEELAMLRAQLNNSNNHEQKECLVVEENTIELNYDAAENNTAI